MTNGDNLPKQSELDAGNIIKPSLEELSEDHRRAYEEYKKAREEKELQDFLGNFKKDRQGNIAPVREIKFPPLHVEQVKPSVSTTFSPEQWAEIDSRITDGNNLVYRACVENTSAKIICLHYLVHVLVWETPVQFSIIIGASYADELFS